jgi:hypothetical protein
MTSAITYQDHANGLDIVVKVGGRVSGYIRRGHWGWRYQPKGTRNFHGEASFSLDVVKQSLEADDKPASGSVCQPLQDHMNASFGRRK